MKHLKQRISLILASVFVFSFLYTTALAGTLDAAATSVQYDFSVDERNISMWGYEIDGKVYFKLLDLAAVLRDTKKQFNVSWDESRNTVLLTIGKGYTPVGGELSKPSNAASALAHSPATDFYIENKQIPIRAYIVNNAHYIMLSDLAANLLFAFSCDEEKHTVEIATSKYDTGIYSFSLPEGWNADGSTYSLNFTHSDESVGSFIIRNYDPYKPISQLEDNHRMTLSNEDLNGFDYHAAKAMIRATQPAATNDNSYVDELHIYIMPEDLRCAFDFCFDSAKVEEGTAMEIAKSFVPKEKSIKMNTVAAQWAREIQKRDGRAQYELLNTKLQSEFKDYYEDANWSTGAPSTWVNSFVVEITGNAAVVFYECRTSEGFAGYTIDILSFSEENGQLKISGIDGYNNFFGY